MVVKIVYRVDLQGYVQEGPVAGPLFCIPAAWVAEINIGQAAFW